MSLKQLCQLQNEVDSQIRKEGLVAIKTALKELFDAYPTLEGVKWEQWTPYFNDGDSCVFSIHDRYIKDSTVGGIGTMSYDWKDDFISIDSSLLESIDTNLINAVEDFFRDLRNLTTWLRWEFGEATITAYRDKDELIITSDPEHD